MDPSSHKEFCCSADGSFVAVGSPELGSNTRPEVCVIRVSDGERFELAEVSYDFGGDRLAIDSRTFTLFSGAYHREGIAAYNFESGRRLWQRRDLKKLQSIAFDPRDDVVYCAFEKGAARPLNARDGRERRHIRGLEGFYFSKNPDLAIFESQEIKLENRAAGISHILPRETWGVLDAAFIGDAVVLSWVRGPVVSYDPKTGTELWRYPTEGTHAFSISPSSAENAVWVAEQPFKEPPWSRLRLISHAGNVEREVRCTLGHSFAVLPFSDKVIRSDLAITPIDMLE